MVEYALVNKSSPMKWALPQNLGKSCTKAHKNRSKISIIAVKPAKRTKNFMPWIVTTVWHHKKYL